MKRDVLVIGEYKEWQLQKFEEEFDAKFVESIEMLKEISLSERQAVKVVAFQGHRGFDEKKLELLPNLDLISNFGVGFDAIDIGAATDRGVKVTNTPDVLNDDVADLAIGLLISVSRRISAGTEWIHSQSWSKFGEMPLNRSISKKKAGIIGLGRIGTEIAKRLEGFKSEIHYHSRQPKKSPKHWKFHSDPVSLAQEVDFLFVSLVGGKQTENYVNSKVIDAMKSEGILINISRGSTVDETALLDALENNSIGGAGLDVFQGEPNINPRFFYLKNVVLQPHQGSGTIESREAMSKLQRDNVNNYLEGKNLITPVN